MERPATTIGPGWYGALRGVCRADFAEYWNPITGQGHDGKPQTWAAVLAAVARHYDF